MIGAGDINIEQKPDKMAIVEVTDTIVYPRTMVIHAKHASSALSAVVGPRRLELLAIAAVPRASRNLLDFVDFAGQAIRFPSVRHPAGVSDDA
jgi:hypothetical protein